MGLSVERIALASLLGLFVSVASQPSYYDSGVSACRPPHDKYPFCDKKLSIDERVKDIIKRIPDSSKERPHTLTDVVVTGNPNPHAPTFIDAQAHQPQRRTVLNNPPPNN